MAEEINKTYTSNSLYNDSTGVIAFAEQLKQELINWANYQHVTEELGQNRPNLQNELNNLFLSVYERFLTFLNDADASEEAVNTWKEIENFLADYTDEKTLASIVAELNNKIESRLTVPLESTTGSSTTSTMTQKAITETIDASKTFTTGEKVDNIGIDNEPTAGSENLVKSGGVYNKISQLDTKIQELLLQELRGAIYETWNTSLGQTHYVIPVNGGETVSFDNAANTMYYGLLKTYSTPISGATPDFCNGYTGRQSMNEPTIINIPSDCRFLVINNPNGNYALTSLIINGVDVVNGVHGSISALAKTIKETKKEFLQYNIPAYPCFVARTTSHDDAKISVSGATGKVYLSSILRSFISLSLTGFDKTKAHFVSLFRNGYNNGTEYQIEFSKIDGNTITQVVRFYIPITQIITVGGVNKIDVTSGDYRIRATIDFSIFPSGGAVVCRTIDYANFIVSNNCFNSIEDETVKYSDIHLKEGVNLANPDYIDDGHYVTNAGGIGTNADWSLIRIPVTPGTKYTFGGFYLGREGYCCFYNGGIIVGNAITFTKLPATVTAPDGADNLKIDIKTRESPAEAYTNLMVNIGEVLAPYEPYKAEIDKIIGYPIIGNENQSINELLANLPVSSDGSAIPSGYAYIEQSTGTIKVKM